MSDQNPYASPVSTPQKPLHDPVPIDLEPKDRRKIKALISDAEGFWLAIVLSIFCYGIGAVALMIWYSVRLRQWRSFAKKHPALLAVGVPHGSLQAKFKSSYWKLVFGMAIGSVLFIAIVMLFLLQ